MFSSLFFSAAFYNFLDGQNTIERAIATFLATCLQTISVFQAPLLLVFGYCYPISSNDDIGYILANVSVYISFFAMSTIIACVSVDSSRVDKATNTECVPEQEYEARMDSYEEMLAEYDERISFQDDRISDHEDRMNSIEAEIKHNRYIDRMSTGTTYAEFALSILISDDESDY